MPVLKVLKGKGGEVDSWVSEGAGMSALNRAWGRFLAIGLLVVAAFCFAMGHSWAQALIEAGLGWAVAGGIVMAVRNRSRRLQVPWWAFAAGIASNAAGTLLDGVHVQYIDIEALSIVANVLWLVLYPAFAAGLAMLARQHTRALSWAGLIDTGIMTTGLGVTMWVGLIEPSWSQAWVDRTNQILALAYPVGDLIVLTLLIRLVLGTRLRSPWFLLLLAAISLTLFGDVSRAAASHLFGSLSPGTSTVFNSSFLVAYVLIGAAVFHPSSSAPVRRPAGGAQRFRSLQLGFLTVASLSAPTILFAEAVAGKVDDAMAIAIGTLVLFTLVVCRMAELLRRVEAQAAHLNRLARIDELTGLPNRRAWKNEAEQAYRRARRDGTPLSIAILDLDHFKQFNDTYGHPAGDGLLRAAAAVWQAQFRDVDMLARYGGEEFVVLFVDARAHEVREALSRCAMTTPLRQTFSGGVATWDGVESMDELIQRADMALYEAKRKGRNRVVLAPSTPLMARVDHLAAAR